MIRQDLAHKRQIFLEDGARPSTFRIWLSDGTSALILYRWSYWLAAHHLSVLAWKCQWLNKVLNGCVIGVRATFGPGLAIMHPVGVVINSKVVAGSRIVIESGVVIGDQKGRSPILGNDLFIGSGAKIVGGITIGDDVKIGANAVVVGDVPDHATVVGVPGKIVSQTAG